MKCYNVRCYDSEGNVYNVGVMTFDEASAARSAIYSMKEGRHIDVKVQMVEETKGI